MMMWRVCLKSQQKGKEARPGQGHRHTDKHTQTHTQLDTPTQT